MAAKMCFKDYIKCTDGLGAVRKKMNKKSHKGRHYGTDQPDAMQSGESTAAPTGAAGTGGGMMGESTEAFTPQFFPRIMWSYRPKVMAQTRGAHYVNQEDSYDKEGDYKGRDEDREPEEEEEVREPDFGRWADEEEEEEPEHDYDIWADEEEEEKIGDGDMPPSNDNVDPEHKEEKEYDNSLNDQNDDPNEELNKEQDDMGQEENQDPNRQGMIRKVPGAHLVYKRQSEEADDFEELWVYKIDNRELKGALSIRKQILSGTDIPRNKTRSEDGEQFSHTWTSGNVQFLEIKGLPN